MKTVLLPPVPGAFDGLASKTKAVKPPLKVKVSFNLELSADDIEGILEECPIGYWGKFTSSKRDTVVLNDETHKGKRRFKVNLKKGFKLMAPSRLQAFYKGEWDGEDEDVLIQLATLGEVIYG